MEHNRAAGSVVGISLCHNHIGRLFEKKGQWDQAIREYRNAYDLMVADNDLYHWLESCLLGTGEYLQGRSANGGGFLGACGGCR